MEDGRATPDRVKIPAREGAVAEKTHLVTVKASEYNSKVGGFYSRAKQEELRKRLSS